MIAIWLPCVKTGAKIQYKEMNRMITEITEQQIEAEIGYCITRISNMYDDIKDIETTIMYEQGKKEAYYNIAKIVKGDNDE